MKWVWKPFTSSFPSLYPKPLAKAPSRYKDSSKSPAPPCPALSCPCQVYSHLFQAKSHVDPQPTQPAKSVSSASSTKGNNLNSQSNAIQLHQQTLLERQVGISEVWRAPSWAHTRQAPERQHLTWPHNPMTNPMTPLTLLETTRQLAISRVWRAPSRAHIHASWFSRPTLVPQPPPPHGFTWSQAAPADPQSGGSRRLVSSSLHHPGSVGGTSTVRLDPGLAVNDGGGWGEGGNQLFRPIAEEARGKENGRIWGNSEQSVKAAWVKLEALMFRREAGKNWWAISSCLDSEIARVEARLKLKSWRVGAWASDRGGPFL